MLKFIRGKGHHQSADRQKLQNELFAYTKTIQHGFPHKPSAMVYDPKTKLLAIGTQTGSLKIYGRPGVEYYGQQPSIGSNIGDCSIQMLEWVSGTGKIVSISSGNQLTLWKPCGSNLNRLHTLSFDGKLKKISCLFCSLSKDIIWIGTEGGNLYQLDLSTLTSQKPIVYNDTIMEQISDSYRLNPGAIECIKQLPNAWDKLLIVYNRGLCVLWDIRDNCILRTYISSGHGQSIGIYLTPSGTEFTWFHADGSYATWGVDDMQPPEKQLYVPYGPDPCKSITNLVKGLRNEDEVVIFSGGMPRSTYGDRHCVSVHFKTGAKICLDFTSKVINFAVVFSDPDPNQCETLIVLLEEEICAFDLADPKLSPIKIPYLSSIHTSAITCNNLISDVTLEVYETIKAAGDLHNASFSKREWPVNGGNIRDNTKTNDKFEIYITGHEDGSVKFWDCTDIVLKPLFYFKTAKYFGHEDVFTASENVDSSYEVEPPFRKAGQFDPFSDDPRLAIKKVVLCSITGQLAIAGTAGQIIIAKFKNIVTDEPLKFTTVNLVSDRDGFLWKGHDELKIRPNLFDVNVDQVDTSIQINEIIQILPPAAITCLTLQTDYSLLAAGTAHGFFLHNYESQILVLSRCTLKPNDLTGASEQLSRRKSFKKTLRESFRRLRRGRSSRYAQNSNRKNLVEPRPVERQIEARPVDDALSSMVRCLVFAKTFITNVHSTVPTFWVATNSSNVSIFILHINNSERNCLITAQLAKEIQLKHRAPVVNILLFDQLGSPLDFHSSVTGYHRVLIASEEQFKVFSLPHLKPINKYKLTAHEGARVRRLAVANFFCQLPQGMITCSPYKSSIVNVDMTSTVSDGCNVQVHNEYGLLCLTNLGDCLVLSIPELKRQLNVAAVRREDINGISSLCFTSSGEALFMISSSELQRISISKTKIVIPKGIIDAEHLQEKNQTVSNYEAEPTNIPTEEESIKSMKLLNIDKNEHKSFAKVMNGDSSSLGNEIVNSYIQDITIDSVKDHLDSTVTTLCSTTTEETISRASIANMHTNNTVISATIEDPTVFKVANVSDLSPLGIKTETNSGSIIIQTCVTNFSKSTPRKEEFATVSKDQESSF